MTSIHNLPPEILRNILSYLFARSSNGTFFYALMFQEHLLIAAAVSKTWHIYAFETYWAIHCAHKTGWNRRTAVKEWNWTIDNTITARLRKEYELRTAPLHLLIKVAAEIDERDILGLSRVKIKW